jgi:hypothetical protein
MFLTVHDFYNKDEESLVNCQAVDIIFEKDGICQICIKDAHSRFEIIESMEEIKLQLAALNLIKLKD